jgi:predicted nucleotidyltransferase
MYADQIKSLLETEPGLKLVILFGSALKDQLRFESDVDVALAMDEPLTWENKLELIERLGCALERPIELVDLHQAHGLILQQILTTGELLICRDRPFYGRLIKRMLFEQADFQPYIDRIHRERRKRWIGV